MLILIGLSTAFLLALSRPLIDFINLFLNTIAINAIFSLSFSVAMGFCYDLSVKQRILYGLAGAFLGKTSLNFAEKVSDFRPTIVNSTRL